MIDRLFCLLTNIRFGYDCRAMNDTAELVAKLKKAGHSVRETWIREDGKVIFSVDGVFMFKHDVVDVAQG